MKYRMLSLFSIILAISIKSIEISAKDYHKLRVLVRAIPPNPYSPQIIPLTFNNEVDSIVFELTQAQGIKEMYLGSNDSITNEFSAYQKLKSLATEKELNTLLKHKSPIVRVYAYRALSINEMDIDYTIEASLFNDTTCLEWYIDEIPTTTSVGEIIQIPFKE